MDGVVFTENDYKILKAILDRNDEKKGLSKSCGTSIKELTGKTKLSDKKVRVTLKRFEDLGYIGRGLKLGKADTYILTIDGFKELDNSRLNIFGR